MQHIVGQDKQRDHDQQRNERNAADAPGDREEACGQRIDRLTGCDRVGHTACKLHHAERHDKRRQVKPGDQHAVDEAKQAGAQDRDDNGRSDGDVPVLHHDGDKHTGQRGDRADGQVNAADQDDEGHADGNGEVDGDLLQDIQQVGLLQKGRGCDSHNDAQNQEGKQNAENIQRFDTAFERTFHLYSVLSCIRQRRCRP